MKVTRTEQIKHLTIDLEYTSLKEGEMALQMIINSIRHGIDRKRDFYLTSICDWSCTTLKVDEYREEMIEGKFHRIYQSKLNKK